MAPLPPETTARYWLVYQNNGTTHRLMQRVAPGTTPATASSNFSAVMTALTSVLNATTIIGMEVAALGSNVRNPVTYSGVTTMGSGTEEGTDGRPRMWSFVGRSSDGRKTKLFIFGVKPISEGDLRVDGSESAAAATVVTLLNTATSGWFSISGVKPVWKDYANVGYNDHWTKEYRKG